MARPQSQAKMGTFPLDSWRAEQLIKIIKNTGASQGKILDPFCDTGEIVKQLGEAWNMQAYGVEIKEEAAREAQTNLGVANALFADSYTGVRMSNNAFDILYLNPPYDIDYSEVESHRAEYKGLRDHWKYLRFGGMVIWVAYKHHISKTVARFFFEKCKRVYPFYWTKEHMGQVQICIIGLKKDSKKGKGMSPNAIEKGVEHLYNVGSRLVDDNIPIDKSKFKEMSERLTDKNHRKGMVVVRTLRSKKDPSKKRKLWGIPINGIHINHFSFATKEPDVKLVKEINEKSGLHRLPSFHDAFRTIQLNSQNEQPIAQARAGQLGLMISAGMMDGIILTHKERRCMMRGSVKTTELTASIKDEVDSHDNTRVITTVHEMPTPSVIILYANGEVENLTEENSLVEFIDIHIKQLLKIYSDRYKPAYDMTIHPMWGEVFDNNSINGKHEALPTQEFVAVATAEQLMRNREEILVGEPAFGKTSIALYVMEMMYQFEEQKYAQSQHHNGTVQSKAEPMEGDKKESNNNRTMPSELAGEMVGGG